MIGAGRVLERREHDPLADRLERRRRRGAVGLRGSGVCRRMGPREERLEVPVRLAARLEPGGDFRTGEGALALLRRPDVEDRVRPEPRDPDVREVRLAADEEDVPRLEHGPERGD